MTQIHRDLGGVSTFVARAVIEVGRSMRQSYRGDRARVRTREGETEAGRGR